MQLLYEISGNLDLKSQRNLFLCSSQLYSKWQLHVPDHSNWHFINRSLDVLEAATLEGLCDPDSQISLFVEAEGCYLPWYITCKIVQQSTVFSLSTVKQETVSYVARHPDGRLLNKCKPRVPITGWLGMTKEQLWHRLTGAPNLASAKIDCVARCQPQTTSNDLRAFAQQAFDLLCITKGVLTIMMDFSHPELEDEPVPVNEDGEELTEDFHCLSLWHTIEPGRPSIWQIDGERCLVDPPNIRFSDAPGVVTMVKLDFECPQPSRQSNLNFGGPRRNFSPDRQMIRDFAYTGNVDIDAWATKQWERAIAHYLEDFIPDGPTHRHH